MKYALILMMVARVAFADCSTNWMDCTSDSPVDVSSFTMSATQTIGEITAARLTATQELQAHKITAVQANIVLANTDRSRTLWQQAVTACNANAAGNCKNAVTTSKAFALLAQAQQVLQ